MLKKLAVREKKSRNMGVRRKIISIITINSNSRAFNHVNSQSICLELLITKVNIESKFLKSLLKKLLINQTL